MILDENDLLTYQLFTASKSRNVRRARIRSWLIMTVTFLFLAYIFYDNNNTTLAIYLLTFAVATLAFYPTYSAWRYKRHYLRNIRENYKGRVGEPCLIEFGDDTIVASDKTSESKVNISEIEVINEIRDYYFIKMKSGVSLMIAKRKCDDLPRIEAAIKALIARGIPHHAMLDWRWK